MKSERRHELQQNELAIYLDRINKSVEPYSKIIAVVVAVLVIGGIGIAFYNTQKSGLRSDATLQLLQAAATQDAEEMLRVSETYPDTAASAWARLYQGKLYLTQGISALYNDRNNAEQLLGDAEAAFRYAMSSSDDPLLRSRANFGIARAAESLGELDRAIEAYREVVAIHESDAMVKKAEDRIEALSNPDTKAFLAWFGDQDFSPADPSLPPSLPGAAGLPQLPDLDLPDLSLDSSGDDQMDLKDGGIEMPQKESNKDAADPPADQESTDAESTGEESTADEPSGEEASGEQASADPSADDDDSDSSQ